MLIFVGFIPISETITHKPTTLLGMKVIPSFPYPRSKHTLKEQIVIWVNYLCRPLSTFCLFKILLKEQCIISYEIQIRNHGLLTMFFVRFRIQIKKVLTWNQVFDVSPLTLYSFIPFFIFAGPTCFSYPHQSNGTHVTHLLLFKPYQ